jgi:putative oxidoreductase
MKVAPSRGFGRAANLICAVMRAQFRGVIVREVHSGQEFADAGAAAVVADNGRIARLKALEEHAVDILQLISLPLLRLAIGAVFIWFGALKISNHTPVADFVANTLPWFDRAWIVPLLGIFEVVIGLALISGKFLTLVCAGLVAHLTGTFLSLVMQPDVTFQNGNPLMLTTEGEFVVKNLVFIAAALVIAARFSRRDKSVVEEIQEIKEEIQELQEQPAD